MKSRTWICLVAAVFAFSVACSDDEPEDPGQKGTGGAGATGGTGGKGGDGGDGGQGGAGGDGGAGGVGGEGGVGGGGGYGESGECDRFSDLGRLQSTSFNAYDLSGLLEYVDGNPRVLELEEKEEIQATYFRLVSSDAGPNGAIAFVAKGTTLPPEGEGADDSVPLAYVLDMPNNIHNGAFGRGEDVTISMVNGWIKVRGTWNSVGLYRQSLDHVPLDQTTQFGDASFRYVTYCDFFDSGCSTDPALYKLIARVGRRELVIKNYGEEADWTGKLPKNNPEWLFSNDGAAYIPGQRIDEQWTCNNPIYLSVITAVHLAETGP